MPDRRTRSFASALLAALVAASVAVAQAPPRSPAQPGGPSVPALPGGTAAPAAKNGVPTERDVVAAFDRKDYAKALSLIERILGAEPGNALMHYNAACALSHLGRIDEAVAKLVDAVKFGFRDYTHLERDPDLDALRDHPTYKAIVEAKGRADADAAQQNFDRWREQFGGDRYRYESDAELNLHFATALDARMHERMTTMLRRQAKQQIATLFSGPPKESVFVAIPTRADAQVFFRDLARRDKTFDSPNVAGIYEHRARRLVTADVGASLRHEFTHAMHYGDMERLGQPHPLWIQEGLASLYEEYELGADGTSIVFDANDRDDVIRGLVRAGQALPWTKLLAMRAEDFMKKPQQLYPQVRSMFRFLAAEKKLGDWYHAYTKGFAEDRTGAKAFERLFGAPLGDVERRWKQWVLGSSLPDRAVQPGDASLGVAIDDAQDGARVSDVIPRSGAFKAGVRTGDVIVSVGGVPTTSASELVAAIAKARIGDVVEVLLRRGKEYLRLKVVLEPLRG